MILQRRALIGGVAAASAWRSGIARAQAWPNRPLRFVVPRTSGGSIDLAGRLIAEAIAGEIGQPVVIEARPGANGIIGSGFVAKSTPDGYTWLLATVNHLVAPLLQPAPFHPVTDFRAAVRLGSFSSVAVVRASLAPTSMHELIAYARERPGALNYLNSGNGSTMHLNTELLKLRQGIDLVSIQYKGMQAGISDLINDRLDFAFTVPSLVLQHIASGKLRALASVAPRRLPELPDVPTLQELGLQDIQLESLFALLGPAGTLDDVVMRLHAAATRVLENESLRRQLAANSLDVLPPTPPAELQTILATEYERYGRLIREAGIKAEG